MTKKEKAFELRSNTEVHYNCAQSVLMPFAGELELTEGKAFDLALNFGGGMGCGGMCGAVTGALMAMGGLGLPLDKRVELIEGFRERFGGTDCAVITAGMEKGSPEMKARCGEFIGCCMDFVCRETGLE